MNFKSFLWLGLAILLPAKPALALASIPDLLTGYRAIVQSLAKDDFAATRSHELSPDLIQQELDRVRAARRAERERVKEKLLQLQLKIEHQEEST